MEKLKVRSIVETPIQVYQKATKKNKKFIQCRLTMVTQVSDATTMQSDTAVHWLHLYDFSPLCVFKCCIKLFGCISFGSTSEFRKFIHQLTMGCCPGVGVQLEQIQIKKKYREKNTNTNISGSSFTGWHVVPS